MSVQRIRECTFFVAAKLDLMAFNLWLNIDVDIADFQESAIKIPKKSLIIHALSQLLI